MNIVVKRKITLTYQKKKRKKERKKNYSGIFGGIVRLTLIISYTNGLRVRLLKFNFAKCLVWKYSSQAWVWPPYSVNILYNITHETGVHKNT